MFLNIAAQASLETQLAACKARITMLEETNKDYQNTIQLLTAKLGTQVVSTQMFCCSLLVFA
jgi:hypothetical protein